MTYEDLKTFVDAAKDILNEIFLPIISGHNVTLIPAHGMDKLLHLVQGKPEEDRSMARNRVDIIYDPMFITWHTNKFYPDTTIDQKMSLLKPHDFSEIYRIIDDIVKDTSKENELINMYSLKKALDTL